MIKIDYLVLQKEFIPFCKSTKESIVIITDQHLEKIQLPYLSHLLKKENISHETIIIPSGESYKTREMKAEIEDILLSKSYSRDTLLVAFGGGVIMDLTGFIAATYCRGISSIYLPTTLLGMVDACLGGKTAINTPAGKNLIGAFYEPQHIFIDTTMLDTLPDAEWRNGLAEMLKHGLIQDSSLVDYLEKNSHLLKTHEAQKYLISKNLEIKKSLVDQDFRDHGKRQWLNFGHTIGHAIERLENYQISHGEAVAIGLIIEAHLSFLLGFIDQSSVLRIENILRNHKLQLNTSAFDDLDLFYSTLLTDKKNIKKKPRFVLLNKIGEAREEKDTYSFEVDKDALHQALIFAKTHFSNHTDRLATEA